MHRRSGGIHAFPRGTVLEGLVDAGSESRSVARQDRRLSWRSTPHHVSRRHGYGHGLALHRRARGRTGARRLRAVSGPQEVASEKLGRHRHRCRRDRCCDPHACAHRSRRISGITARFTRAGHIVGSACVRLQLGGVSLTFSGDVGRLVDPVMKPPASLGETDFLVVESTYGDRRHPITDLADHVARIVGDTVARGRAVVVPAFAVGRAQHDHSRGRHLSRARHSTSCLR